MFYLFSKSILIEIGFKKDVYYIGNTKFEFIPDSVLNNCYSSANWNRALKYKIEENVIEKKYFMLDVDVYWNLELNKIELMSKIFFFNEIINSKHFEESFLNTFFAHYFKHTLKINDVKKVDPEFIKIYTPEISKDNLRIQNFDNFILLNKDVQINDKKFKSIINIGENSFKWKVNKFNQILYSFPSDILNENSLLKNADFIDTNNSLFYTNTLTNLNKNIVLEFCIYNKKIRDELLQKMIIKIKDSKDPLFNWHLFNITKDTQYLKNELKKISEDPIEREDYLKNVYSKLKRNYDKELLNVNFN
ncbi:hypothetical protein [Mesoplasma florum]|uniref:hypothetical protein n=1 Tax=Mesoplasma florum TaxID=2151 RepID=UPI000BE29597|nr:hypothetical protein [Mesoplasma florum]ATI74263.1 hypothetical protein CQZ70_03390 [Mesoplasma florum]